MVLLADKASDDGRGIYASKQTMADELCTSKQTVITVIKELLADGLLKAVGQNKITAGYTVEYAINVAKLQALPLVKCHADRESRGLTSQAALPVKDDDQTSQAALPDQSSSFTQTLQEPSKNHIDKAKALPIARVKIQKPVGVEQNIWNDFLDLRKAKRAPLSNTALAAIEREAALAGWSLNDALAECAARGWQGFKAKWVEEKQSGQSGNRQADSMGRTERAAMQALRDLGLAPAETGTGQSGSAALPAARSHADARRQSSALLTIGHERGGSG